YGSGRRLLPAAARGTRQGKSRRFLSYHASNLPVNRFRAQSMRERFYCPLAIAQCSGILSICVWRASRKRNSGFGGLRTFRRRAVPADQIPLDGKSDRRFRAKITEELMRQPCVDDFVRLLQDIPELGLIRNEVGVVRSTWFAP